MIEEQVYKGNKFNTIIRDVQNKFESLNVTPGVREIFYYV